MKSSVVILVTLSLLIMSASTAKAVCVNPAEWHFSLVTYGPNDCWNSSTCVEPGYPEYDYEWELTHEGGPWPAVQVVGQWFDIWNDIDPGDKSGSGTFFGELPTEDRLIIHIDYPEIEADFYATIDSEGYGHISIRNVDFGLAEGYPVTGARFTGNVTVTAVPEPATIVLLGMGVLITFTRRKRSV